MNIIFRNLLLIVLALSLSNCRDEDGPDTVPLRDYQQQFESDLADIEEFLKTHSITVTNHPGFSDDQDVTYSEVAEGDPNSIWLNTTYPLLTRTVQLHNIEYKIYYLNLRQGGGFDNDKPKPCDVDAVLASYEGSYMFHFSEDGVDELKTYEFESVPFPQNNLNLEGVIKGWREIFPEFNAGDVVDNVGNPSTYTDFGAGVMFLPSGLAYYNQSSAIPAYSPLIFSFKLYEVSRLDQDQDGIDSWLEDHNGDRHLTIAAEGVDNADNSDDDVTPDYLDLDDDNDNVLTKVEIKDPSTGQPYEFNSIPTCTTGGLKKHRDPSCH